MDAWIHASFVTYIHPYIVTLLPIFTIRSWQPFVVIYAVFVGFHNPYAGDFGPFVTFHDGAFDFSVAAKEWQRLH